MNDFEKYIRQGEPQQREKGYAWQTAIGSQEKNFGYKDLNINDAITHIAKFVLGIWQIHAFGEGNTCTMGVFTIKYLRTFGFDISNEEFANHLWYFRNALVCANYNN